MSPRAPLLFATVLAACATGTGRRPAAELGNGSLAVADAQYRLRLSAGVYHGAIPFRYANRGARPAAVAACRRPDPARLERWDGRGWVRAFEPVRQLCQGPPLVIGPEQTVLDTLWISAGASGNRNFPQWPAGPGAGRYRLVWDVAEVAPAATERNTVGALRPESERVSNTFVLIVEGP